MFRKMVLVCVGLLLAFAAASVITSYGRAAEESECKNPSPLRFGRMGVVAGGADFTCRVRVRALKPEVVPAMKGGEIPRSAISIKSRVDRNDRTIFNTPSYVYFDLSPSEAAAWRNGKLQIVMYNSIRDQWESVTTVQIPGKSGVTRIGNLLRHYGLYGLSKTK